MTRLIAGTVAALLLTGCPAAKTNETATAAAETVAPAPAPAPAAAESAAPPASAHLVTETWAGELKVAEPVSTFHYVGAETGDWVPMRLRNDSEAGKKILAACSNDDRCEFTGTIEFLEEPPPTDASAIAQIVSVTSVKRLPPEAP